MQNTLDFIDSNLIDLETSYQYAITNGNIDDAIAMTSMKILLNSVREVAHADKVAQDKLDFERSLKSC